MSVLRWILTILLILLGIAITALVLFQEGKSQGLGAISGIAESYWGKNKAHSMEGQLVKYTAIACAVFFVICILLNTHLF